MLAATARPTGSSFRAARDGVFSGFVPGLKEGARYGFRADGDYAPERGLWFDPDKLLIDPYAVEIDRPYVYDAQAVGAARRGRRHRAADAEGDREGACRNRCRDSRRSSDPAG